MTYRATLFAIAVAVASACTSSGGGGSQTSWVECKSKAECATGQACIEHRCRSPQPVADARPDGRHTEADGRSTAANELTRSSLPRSAPESATAQAVADAVAANTNFGLSLYARLAGQSGSDNLVFSPLGITVAMGMALAGARGETAREIETVFGFGDPSVTHAALNALAQRLEADESRLVVRLANALWISPTMKPLPEYLDVLATQYGSGVGLVDFGNPKGAADTIDAWASENTKGTIPRLLEAGDLTSNATAVLTNALYFKGTWVGQFDKTTTMEAGFEVTPGMTVPVKMMRNIVSARYTEGDDYQAAALPYQAQAGRGYEMIAVLPKADLSTFERGLDVSKLGAVLSSLRQQDVDVAMPRFELRSALRLAAELGAMGMPAAFGGNADFSGVSNPPPGYVDDVVHQGFLSVDENGTEASAATAVVFVDGSVIFRDAQPPVLRLDRPFLVLIRHVQTGAVLFMARVVRP